LINIHFVSFENVYFVQWKFVCGYIVICIHVLQWVQNLNLTNCVPFYEHEHTSFNFIVIIPIIFLSNAWFCYHNYSTTDDFFYNRKDIFYPIKIQGTLTYLLEISRDYGKMGFKCNYYWFHYCCTYVKILFVLLFGKVMMVS